MDNPVSCTCTMAYIFIPFFLRAVADSKVGGGGGLRGVLSPVTELGGS